MKKLFLTLALIGFIGAASAQDYTQKEVRDQKRAQNAQVFTQRLTAALQARNFTFIAQQVTPNFGPTQPVNGINNYLSVYPNYLSIELPYMSFNPNVPTPKMLNFSTNTYEYKFNIVGAQAYVTITVGNVQNLQNLNIPQELRYVMHLELSLATGNGTLTVLPNFNTNITYQGVVQFN